VKVPQIIRQLPNVERFPLMADASSHDLLDPQMTERIQKNAFGRLE
jgi:hypothetical protein